MKVISGFLKGRNLFYLKDKTLRPTKNVVREGILDTLRGWIGGKTVLEIFAGNGGLGIEAISQGAAAVLFVEAQKRAAELIRKNLIALGIEDRAEVILGKAEPVLKKMTGRVFDLVLADPPYRYKETDLEEIMRILLEKGLLSRDGFFVLEHHPKRVVPESRGWHTWKRKNYGSTCVDFLKRSL